MNNIMTIVKKEFKDILRDRKTLLMTFIIPIIIMPLLFTFIFSSINDLASPSENNKYKIVLETNNPEISTLFNESNIYELVKSADPINDAYNGKITAYIIANDINEFLLQGKTPKIDLYYDTTSQRALTAISTVQTMFSTYQNNYLTAYLKQNNLSSDILNPFTYNEHAKDNDADNLSLMMLGMLIPMMIIGYSGSGIVPIATDLGAGEKERGTLEPLLSTSVSRSSILIGKLIVTATFGIITSILSAAGLLLAFKFGLSDMMSFSINLSAQGMFLIILLAILYVIFISAVMLLVSTYARSLKEANTYLTPVTLIPVLLSVITMYMEPSTVSTSMMNIPILNVVVVIKEIIYNQLNYIHLYMTIGWSVIYVIIAMIGAKMMYEKEEIIFRA
ncbi:MAG: ABC transporter permease [[Clostridium] spiroforme]|uniref:ABC transporter permease n=1 Tax=Thomasclavelia spiroformis TaxID=29348 RepID=A0A943EIX7_9FIRM|nr:ABC transporter permease [Thomasclavelia spiroformis]MBS5588974.1 ABC transporter permease [Thomasclavelia spiroformis]